MRLTNFQTATRSHTNFYRNRACTEISKWLKNLHWTLDHPPEVYLITQWLIAELPRRPKYRRGDWNWGHAHYSGNLEVEKDLHLKIISKHQEKYWRYIKLVVYGLEKCVDSSEDSSGNTFAWNFTVTSIKFLFSKSKFTISKFTLVIIGPFSWFWKSIWVEFEVLQDSGKPRLRSKWCPFEK